MLAELRLKLFWRRHSLPAPPLLLARLLSITLLLLIAGPLFFGPVELDTDTADRVVQNCKQGFLAAAALLTNATGTKLEL